MLVFKPLDSPMAQILDKPVRELSCWKSKGKGFGSYHLSNF
jgi:hypothetical protein